MRTKPNHPSSLPAQSETAIAGVTPTPRLLEAGSALFRQGDTTFGLFRLIAGCIRLVRITPEGTLVPMHTVRAGELFAEASLFSARYHCDAIALEHAEVLVYPKAQLVRALQEDPQALWAFAGELAQRLQGMRTRIEIGRIRSASERVLQALHLRCDAAGSWKVDGTLKRFGEEIGLTHEALYRALAALERDGCISRDGGVITLQASVHRSAP